MAEAGEHGVFRWRVWVRMGCKVAFERMRSGGGKMVGRILDVD